jgi:hypothetical protein
MLRCVSFVMPLLATAGCATERTRSPACGLALIAGPAIIQEQLRNARAVLTDAPRGLPETLPARVIGQSQGRVAVGYVDGRLALRYDGGGFPQTANELNGYGLLVVDDTSQRVQGVLVYESELPRDHPRLGDVTSGGTTLPLFGVRLDWASMSNPRCPLLGDTTATR